MEAIALSAKFLSVPAAFVLKATCRTIRSAEVLARTTTQNAWREFHETLVLEAHDVDINFRRGRLLLTYNTTGSQGFSEVSPPIGHYYTHVTVTNSYRPSLINR